MLKALSEMECRAMEDLGESGAERQKRRPKPWERAGLGEAELAHGSDVSLAEPLAHGGAEETASEPRPDSARRHAVSEAVLQAARFIQHPSVAGMRGDALRAFLRSKGMHAWEIDQAFALVAESSRLRMAPGSGAARAQPGLSELASTAASAVGVASGAARQFRLVRGLLLCALASLCGFGLCRLLIELARRIKWLRRAPRQARGAAAPPLAVAASPGGVSTSARTLGCPGAGAPLAEPTAAPARAEDEIAEAGGAAGAVRAQGVAPTTPAEAGRDVSPGAAEGLRRALEQLSATCTPERFAERQGSGASSAPATPGAAPEPHGADGRAEACARGGEAQRQLSLRTLLVFVNNALGCVARPGSARINTATVQYARVASCASSDFLAALGAQRPRERPGGARPPLRAGTRHPPALTSPRAFPAGALRSGFAMEADGVHLALGKPSGSERQGGAGGSGGTPPGGRPLLLAAKALLEEQLRGGGSAMTTPPHHGRLNCAAAEASSSSAHSD